MLDRSEPVPEAYHVFNRLTQDGRKMEAYSALLEKGIHSIVDLKEEKDMDSLFTGTRTTALLNTVKGLEDFELIAFVVVQTLTEGDAFRTDYAIPMLKKRGVKDKSIEEEKA